MQHIEVRVSLSEVDFLALVAGELVHPQQVGVISDSSENPHVVVKIALQDIGWDRMYRAIDTATL